MVHWPNFNPQYPVPAAPGVIPPSSPFVSIAPNTGRLTAHLSVERRLPARAYPKDLVVDAAYVGNRGAWWVSPLLSSLNYNALTPQELLSNTDSTCKTGGHDAPQYANQFARRDRALPVSGQSE